MAFCRYCGNKLNDGDTVCANCGNEVKAKQNQEPQENNIPEEKNPALNINSTAVELKKNKKNHKRLIIIIISTITAVAILSCIPIYLFHKNNANDFACKCVNDYLNKGVDEKTDYNLKVLNRNDDTFEIEYSKNFNEYRIKIKINSYLFGFYDILDESLYKKTDFNAIKDALLNKNDDAQSQEDAININTEDNEDNNSSVTESNDDKDNDIYNNEEFKSILNSTVKFCVQTSLSNGNSVYTSFLGSNNMSIDEYSFDKDGFMMAEVESYKNPLGESLDKAFGSNGEWSESGDPNCPYGYKATGYDMNHEKLSLVLLVWQVRNQPDAFLITYSITNNTRDLYSSSGYYNPYDTMLFSHIFNSSETNSDNTPENENDSDSSNDDSKASGDVYTFNGVGYTLQIDKNKWKNVKAANSGGSDCSFRYTDTWIDVVFNITVGKDIGVKSEDLADAVKSTFDFDSSGYNSAGYYLESEGYSTIGDGYSAYRVQLSNQDYNSIVYYIIDNDTLYTITCLSEYDLDDVEPVLESVLSTFRFK